MDPQMALPRALLLLLLLHLSPLGGHCRPAGGRSPALELSGVQKLLDHLQDTASELQADQMALETLQEGSGSADAWEAELANFPGGLGGDDFQDQQESRGTKTIWDLGCFGRKMDRISTHTRLGCNVLTKH